MKKSILIIAMFLTTCEIFAQHDHSAVTEKGSSAPTFRDVKLGSAYADYIKLKDALVSSDAESARKAAVQLGKSLASVQGGQNAAAEAKKIAAATDINAQRASFTLLSNEMTPLVKGTKLTSGTLYLEFCPMANNNKGAFWLSNEKEIRNPYFGEKMLKCGSVKETVQ